MNDKRNLKPWRALWGAACLLYLYCALVFSTIAAADRFSELEAGIGSSATTAGLDAQFQELIDIAVKQNRFQELHAFLKTLGTNKVFANTPLLNYAQAISYFQELRYLEEHKMWEEFFDNREPYTAQILSRIEKIENLQPLVNPLLLKSKIMEWELVKDNPQQSYIVLEELYALSKEYAAAAQNGQVVKDIAEELNRQKETTYSRKLYALYIDALAKNDSAIEELKHTALDFLKEKRIDLAVSLYDTYLDKLTKSTHEPGYVIQEMLASAELFAHTGWKEGLDPFYAENIYKRIESKFSRQAFDAMSQYGRAYNLERTRDYEASVEQYKILISDFPEFSPQAPVYFRMGIINVYALNRIEEAQKLFLAVVEKFPSSPEYFNSLYQLGLLAQWQNEPQKAKEYYATLIAKAQEIELKGDAITSAQQRIEEIDSGSAMEYASKLFLDATLQEKQDAHLQLVLLADKTKAHCGDNVKFSVQSFTTNTGCLQESYSYVWSGQLGTNNAPSNSSEIETGFPEAGTNNIQVVLVDPAGIAGAAFEIVDVLQEVTKE